METITTTRKGKEKREKRIFYFQFCLVYPVSATRQLCFYTLRNAKPKEWKDEGKITKEEKKKGEKKCTRWEEKGEKNKKIK